MYLPQEYKIHHLLKIIARINSSPFTIFLKISLISYESISFIFKNNSLLHENSISLIKITLQSMKIHYFDISGFHSKIILQFSLIYKKYLLFIKITSRLMKIISGFHSKIILQFSLIYKNNSSTHENSLSLVSVQK